MLAAMLGKERFMWADTDLPLSKDHQFLLCQKISPWFRGWYVSQPLSESCARPQVPPEHIHDDDDDDDDDEGDEDEGGEDEGDEDEGDSNDAAKSR